MQWEQTYTKDCFFLVHNGKRLAWLCVKESYRYTLYFPDDDYRGKLDMNISLDEAKYLVIQLYQEQVVRNNLVWRCNLLTEWALCLDDTIVADLSRSNTQWYWGVFGYKTGDAVVSIPEEDMKRMVIEQYLKFRGEQMNLTREQQTPIAQPVKKTVPLWEVIKDIETLTEKYGIEKVAQAIAMLQQMEE